MKRVHLVCNAHLDPVWLWEWPEGAAATLSTFRTAADLCEEFDGFVFNHNEAVLYQWVEQYEPALFSRLQRLVRRGKWNIAGGWFLQPDCNMPTGESLVRQILVGRSYFRDKFGVEPTTAVNYDTFGHSRGMVQVLTQCGYDSYICCRPMRPQLPLPEDNIVWVGLDGSEVMVNRNHGWYNSGLGKAAGKVKKLLSENSAAPELILWGVGDHGGGPSRQDLTDLAALIRDARDVQIVHSTPEAYFRELAVRKDSLHRHTAGLNTFGPGIYTCMVRVKQKHRELENELYSTEKMLTAAWLAGLMQYPAASLAEATEDLLACQFHDVLPGSSIPPVEEASMRRMDHGLEILSRLKAQAFFALCQGQPPAPEGQIPILAYNPHPYPVNATVECEFQLADINMGPTWTTAHVFSGKDEIPCQVEKELSNLTLDWRKRPVFAAKLAPGINRFDCGLEVLPSKPSPPVTTGDMIRVAGEGLDARISAGTGLMEHLAFGGVEMLDGEGFLPLVIKDSEDPWGMSVKRYGEVLGRFQAMSPQQAARFAGVRADHLPPVRVVEDGPVRTVVEALLECEGSQIVQRYFLPKRGAEFSVELRVLWNQKDRMLKLALPLRAPEGKVLGETVFGTDPLATNGSEAVVQKWVAVVWGRPQTAFSCINDGSYGLDFLNGQLRLTLLHSPSYSGHPIEDRPIVPQDRFTPRMDQGERVFRFWFNAGPAQERLAALPREAQAHNEKPFALSFFPSGGGKKPKHLATLGDDAVVVSAVKKSHKGGDVIVRLYEPTGEARTTTLSLPPLGIRRKLAFRPFQVKTLRINRRTKAVKATDPLERKIEAR